MDYLTNFYKNKAEQLQEKVNYLVALLEGAEEKFAAMTDAQFEDYVKSNPGTEEKARELRARGKAKQGQTSQQSQQSSQQRSQSTAQDEAAQRARQQAADAARQQASDRAQRQADAEARERARANSSSEQARQQQQGAEARARTTPPPTPESNAKPTPEPSYAPKTAPGVGAAFEKEFTTFPATEAAAKAAKTAATSPGETAKKVGSAAWETIAKGVNYAAEHPGQAAWNAAKGVGKFGLYGLGPMIAGSYVGKTVDLGMGAGGFKENEPEKTIKIGDSDVGIPYSDAPSVRSTARNAADWGVMNLGFQVGSNLAAGEALATGALGALGTGLVAGAVAPAVGYGAYKIGEKIGEKTGFHDWLADKIQSPKAGESQGKTKTSDYPTVAELQRKSMEARNDQQYAELAAKVDSGASLDDTLTKHAEENTAREEAMKRYKEYQRMYPGAD